jgi:predicted Zn-dependent protease
MLAPDPQYTIFVVLAASSEGRDEPDGGNYIQFSVNAIIQDTANELAGPFWFGSLKRYFPSEMASLEDDVRTLVVAEIYSRFAVTILPGDMDVYISY